MKAFTRTTITALLFLFLGACSLTPQQPTRSGSSATTEPTTQPVAKSSPETPTRLPTIPSAQPDDRVPNEWGTETELAATVRYDDIWQRIRANPSFEHHLNEPSVQRKLKWYSQHQDFLNRVAERATPYIYYIVEELEARNMPLELALLPIVESAYKPLAYSRSHASGIWQFIPSTGRNFGLKQNWWYDGRRDITAATDAALDYLQFLHNKLNGNWLHALAGYNAGGQRVLEAIEDNQQAQKPTDFWHLPLPSQTRDYVPALLAISELIAYPERYGVTLKPISNQPYFTKVATGGQIDLGKAADLAGISEAELRQLNPGFKRWATDPNGPHSLLLPLNKAEAFEQALASLPDSERISSRQHEIRRGETLSQIADRYGTTVAMLQRTNRLEGSLIRAGMRLQIPTHGSGHNAPQSTGEQTTAADRPEADRRLYTVRHGDTLWTIARRYDRKVAALTRVNNITANSVLQPGQQLQIPTVTTADNTHTDTPALVHYTVRPGDTLWKISRKFQVTVSALREWNSLQQQALLQPGQELELYVGQHQDI